MALPHRRCVGCGAKRPKSELVRFVVSSKRLTPKESGGGRGAYLCREAACASNVVRNKGAFSRVLKTEVLAPDIESLTGWITKDF